MKRCGRFLCLFLMLVLLLGLSSTGLAVGAVNDIRLNQVQQSGEKLTMYLSMVDSKGIPINSGLNAEDFSVQIDDTMMFTPDSIQPFDPKTMGINYVFCIDVSKSISTDMMKNIQSAFVKFVSGLGAMDTVTVLTFGDRVQTLTTGDGDMTHVKSIINSIQPTDNSTALFKGVLDGVVVARELGGRSAVIMITDGRNDVAQQSTSDDVRQYTSADVIFNEVVEAQVPLYCIGLTDDERYLDKDSLNSIANATGGNRYLTSAAEMSKSMSLIQMVMTSTMVLEVTPLNTEGRVGFRDLTTFLVGYQTPEGAFVDSNELQQKINWSKIKAPEVTPEPTQVPSIGLELDEDTIELSPDGRVEISGVIEVNQGSVSEDELEIVVNGESWPAEFNPNGSDFVFEANGVISTSSAAPTLEVSARIRDGNIQSRTRKLNVATPTPGPDATPAPVLTLTLGNMNQNLMLQNGGTLELIGVVKSENGAVNPEDLAIVINDVPCDDCSFQDIGSNQYEFSANYVMNDGTTELNISAQLVSVGITSGKQRIYLATPSPTPAPQLSLMLDQLSVEYTQDNPVTISGTVEVNGQVDASDLSLYVRSVQWPANFTPNGDGSFHFEATNPISGDVPQLDVRVRLNSNSSISAEPVILTAVLVTPPPVTPEPPPATPTPSPSPTPTPSPTPEPTKANPVMEIVDNLKASGKFEIVLAGVGVLLLLIVVLIVLLTVRANKNRKARNDTGNFDTTDRSGNTDAGATVRPDMVSDVPPTVNSSGETGNSGFIDEPSFDPRRNTIDIDNIETGGTIFLGRDTESSGTIMDLGGRYEDYDGYGSDAHETNGTLRISDEDEEFGGTERIVDDEDIPTIEIVADESCKKQPRGQRTITLLRDEAKTLGRSDRADIVFDESTVSERHARLLFDGVNVSIEDLGSTNGTKVNKEKLEPNEEHKLNDGDVVSLGRITLALHIGEPTIN